MTTDPTKTDAIDLIAKLRPAAAKAHEIVAAVSARRLIRPGMNNTIRAKLEAGLRSDEAIGELAADVFEAIVRVLGAAGDPTATIRECGAADIDERPLATHRCTGLPDTTAPCGWTGPASTSADPDADLGVPGCPKCGGRSVEVAS